MKSNKAIINVKFIFLPLVIIVFVFFCRFIYSAFKGKGNVCQPTVALSQEGASLERKTFTRSRLNFDERELGPGRFFTVQEKSLRAGPATNAENSLLRLKDYIKSLEEKNNSLKEKVELLTNLLNSKESELLGINEDYENLKENLYKTIETQNQFKSDLTQGNISLQKQIDRIEQEKWDLENKLKASKEETLRLAAANEELNKNLKAMNAQVEEAKDSILNLSNLLSKKEIEVKDVQSVAAKAKENAGKMTFELEGKDKALQDMRVKLKEIDSAKVLLAKELEAQKLRNEQISKQLDEMAAAKEELKQAELDNENLKKMLDREKASRNEALQQVSQNLASGKELRQAQKEAASLRAQLESERTLRDNNEREANVSLGTNKKLEIMSSDISKLKDQLIIERKDAQRIRSGLKEQEVLNNSLKAKLKSIYTELELLRVEKSFEQGALQSSPRTKKSIYNSEKPDSGFKGQRLTVDRDLNVNPGLERAPENDTSVEVITDEKRKNALLLELDNFTAGE